LHLIITVLFLKCKKIKTALPECKTSLNSKINTLTFGNSSTGLKDVLSSGWISNVPDDGLIHHVSVVCKHGNVMGIITRYSTNYGMLIGARYDGSIYLASLSGGAVLLWNLNNAKTEATE